MAQLDELLALSLIERGSRMAPLDRAVLMAAAFGDLPEEAAADLPLDLRDRLLTCQRRASFGPRIDFFARCPHCGEGNEAEFDLDAMPEPGPREVEAEAAGRHFRFRAPSSREVGAAVLAGDPLLLARATSQDPDLPSEPDVIAAVETALGQAFPLLDPRFDLACTACDTAFSIRFDIAAWLWREVEHLAARALDAVDRLARAYGWSEGEILGLSPARRSLYLARMAG